MTTNTTRRPSARRPLSKALARSDWRLLAMQIVGTLLGALLLASSLLG